MYRRNKALWFLSGIVAILASIISVKAYLYWQSSHFSCDGEMYVHKKEMNANLTVKYVFNGNTGVALLRGELLPAGRPPQLINQNVFFNVQRKDNDYFLTSKSVMGAPDESPDPTLMKMAIPLFYQQSDVQFYLNIKRLSGNSWLFTTSRTPSLFCSS